MQLLPRAEEARMVLEKCRTAEGFNASAGSYRELWLRDLVYSVDPLLKLGYSLDVKRHFEFFLRFQLRSGQIPTVLSRGWKRIFNQRFQSWTSDTEPLLLVGAHEYARLTGDSGFLEENRVGLERCIDFTERKLSKEGLLPGADWRDAMIGYDRRFLLSNQVILANAYTALGRRESAEGLKDAIRDGFHLDDEDYLADCVWWEGGGLKRESRLDCLGNSMAIISGVLTGRGTSMVAGRFEVAKTRHGYTNIAPPMAIRRMSAFTSARDANQYVRNGAILRNRPHHYQNSAIWPFVEGVMIKAFRVAGLSNLAGELAERVTTRRGFAEWYSPITGSPKGSKDQLWTAAAVLEQHLPRNA